MELNEGLMSRSRCDGEGVAGRLAPSKEAITEGVTGVEGGGRGMLGEDDGPTRSVGSPRSAKPSIRMLCRGELEVPLLTSDPTGETASNELPGVGPPRESEALVGRI